MLRPCGTPRTTREAHPNEDRSSTQTQQTLQGGEVIPSASARSVRGRGQIQGRLVKKVASEDEDLIEEYERIFGRELGDWTPI